MTQQPVTKRVKTPVKQRTALQSVPRTSHLQHNEDGNGLNTAMEAFPQAVACQHTSRSRDSQMPKPKTVTAQFEDDNNLVQFEVERDFEDEFPSEGEVSDSDSQSELDESSQSQPSMYTNAYSGRSRSKSVENHFGPDEKQKDKQRTSLAGHDTNNNASFLFKTGDTSASQNVTDTETVVDPGDEAVCGKSVGAQDNLHRLEQEFTDNNKKMEQKIDKLMDALVAMQDIIMKNGKKDRLKHVTVGNEGTQLQASHGDSATTIYRNVLQQIPAEFIPVGQTSQADDTGLKRVSTSSDEGQIDTSDELIELNGSHIFSAHNTATPMQPSAAGPMLSEPQPGTSTGKQGYSANVPQLAVQ